MTPISEEDYFAKNPEFSAWLRDLQHIHFNELTAEASREQFKVCCSRGLAAVTKMSRCVSCCL